jgi:hypothetical protein
MQRRRPGGSVDEERSRQPRRLTLPIDLSAARNVCSRSLVEAEAGEVGAEGLPLRCAATAVIASGAQRPSDRALSGRAPIAAPDDSPLRLPGRILHLRDRGVASQRERGAFVRAPLAMTTGGGGPSARSGPSISRRSKTSMARPSSRPKPPKAGAEGPPLRGSGRRRQSGAEVGGRLGFRDSVVFVDGVARGAETRAPTRGCGQHVQWNIAAPPVTPGGAGAAISDRRRCQGRARASSSRRLRRSLRAKRRSRNLTRAPGPGHVPPCPFAAQRGLRRPRRAAKEQAGDNATQAARSHLRRSVAIAGRAGAKRRSGLLASGDCSCNRPDLTARRRRGSTASGAGVVSVRTVASTAIHAARCRSPGGHRRKPLAGFNPLDQADLELRHECTLRLI